MNVANVWFSPVKKEEQCNITTQSSVILAGLQLTQLPMRLTLFFSLATKNSGLVATLADRFLYDLNLNLKSKVKTNISSYLALLLP